MRVNPHQMRPPLDFTALFKALEAKGYDGHYMNAFGSLDDMLRARTLFAEIALA